MAAPKPKQPRAFTPWFIPEPTLPEVVAIRAVANGEASSEQQRLCMAWIRWRACGEGELSFVPGDPHATSFAEGRRRVGLALKSYIAAPDLSKFRSPDAPPREQD